MDKTIACAVYLVFLSLLSTQSVLSTTHLSSFLHCLHQHSVPNAIIVSNLNTTTFTAILNSTIQNPRTITPRTPKPLLLLNPTQESHVQSVVICARKFDIQTRIRSGGHDYEGLSYVSYFGPFVLMDLANLHSIFVNTTDNTVWVQSGAKLGQLYYTIAEKAGPTFGFPAGLCPTVGVGGHFSGGGFGTLMRSQGIAADHIIDARLVNANGEIMDRESMGEDLFWAIRGGGGVSFGVTLSYKVNLVPVPPTVTVFTIRKTLDQGLAGLVTKWQHVAPNIDERLLIRVLLTVGSDTEKNKTVEGTFDSLFLGPKEELLPLMKVSFPELGLEEKECREMSWVNSTLFFSGYLDLGRNLSALLDKHDLFFSSFKGKSDFVREPISEEVWEEIFSTWFLEGGKISPTVFLYPFGGRMNAIPETAIPFPHRKGNLYIIQYLVDWNDTQGSRATKKYIDFSRKLYKFMTPHVSKNPRAAYVNFRDLDLGKNKEGEKTSYSKASVWGRKYFKGNFKRLAYVKAEVDPENFFRNEQSVPPHY